jgi:hypothetical protein
MASSTNFDACFQFHPVGQGLFASGCIRINDDKQFSWVYDCGTVSSQTLIDDSLGQMCCVSAGSTEKKTIDLLVLSHFDKDHISGVTRLLAKFSVRTLLLPYMPLWQRLKCAIENGIDTQQDAMNFFINPVMYLRGVEGASIQRIVFVPPSQRKLVPDEVSSDNLIVENSDNLLLNISKMDNEESAEIFGIDPIAKDFRAPSTDIMMQRNSAIQIGNLWEFVPYNDMDLSERSTGTFQTTVQCLANSLTSVSDDNSRKEALKKIRDKYDEVFGSSAEQRNLISLFLYCGSTDQTSKTQNHPAHTKMRCYSSEENYADKHFFHKRYLYFERDKREIACLYTGDGYLNNSKRLNTLCDSLGKSRMLRIKIFQVMHHGARTNWYQGVAAKFASAISVFSSNPSHEGLGHPHAEVLRDFWPYCPVQVSKHSGLRIEVH